MYISFNNQGYRVEDLNWRQKSLLDAALQCFLDRGIRGTSMEAVAQQGGVAKATLYKYYADKHVLFDAVVGNFLEQVKLEIAPILQRDVSASDAVSDFLIAKYCAIDEAVQKSAHQAELFSAYNNGAILAFAAFDEWLRAQISTLLEKTECAEPELTAQIVTAAVGGITRQKDQFEDWKATVRLTVQRLVQS